MTVVSMEAEGLLTNFKNGDKAKPISRAWWLDRALDCGNGRVEVARIWAKSVAMRYPAKQELLPGILAPNRYDYSRNYTGEWAVGMVAIFGFVSNSAMARNLLWSAQKIRGSRKGWP